MPSKSENERFPPGIVPLVSIGSFGTHFRLIKKLTQHKGAAINRRGAIPICRHRQKGRLSQKAASSGVCWQAYCLETLSLRSRKAVKLGHDTINDYEVGFDHIEHAQIVAEQMGKKLMRLRIGRSLYRIAVLRKCLRRNFNDISANATEAKAPR